MLKNPRTKHDMLLDVEMLAAEAGESGHTMLETALLNILRASHMHYAVRSALLSSSTLQLQAVEKAKEQ